MPQQSARKDGENEKMCRILWRFCGDSNDSDDSVEFTLKNCWCRAFLRTGLTGGFFGAGAESAAFGRVRCVPVEAVSISGCLQQTLTGMIRLHMVTRAFHGYLI